MALGSAVKNTWIRLFRDGGLRTTWSRPDAERPLRSLGVVFDPPGFDHAACMGEAAEPVLVWPLVSELAVEAFDVAVLVRLAEPDEGYARRSGTPTGRTP